MCECGFPNAQFDFMKEVRYKQTKQVETAVNCANASGESVLICSL
jgi:hypothetical protein